MQTNKLGALAALIFCIFGMNQYAMADLEFGIAEFRKGNYAVAIKEITLEAERGNPEAQVLLGEIYASGTGVIKNQTTAFTWFQKAANQGNNRGQELLGWTYLNGQGVTKDAKAAFKTFQLAANGGNKDAQYQVSLMPESVTSNFPASISAGVLPIVT